MVDSGSEIAIILKGMLRDVPDSQMAQAVTVMKEAIAEFERRGGKAEPVPEEAQELLDGPLKFLTSRSMFAYYSKPVPSSSDEEG